jgi:S-(hydroxymethyl)glutathione dehydrogenase/alcohol dehydrogenase
VDKQVVSEGFSMIRKGGRLVITAVSSPDLLIEIPSFELTLYQKAIVGSLFGSGNPHYDIPKLIDLYLRGSLKLDQLITTRYSLDDVNKGYDDMLAGKNIRGLLEISH